MNDPTTLSDVTEEAKKVGRLEERNRILNELLQTDLPFGVWTHIKNIINPEP